MTDVRKLADKNMATPKLSRKELAERLRREFPEASHTIGDYEIEDVWHGGCRLRLRYDRRALRPGGTLVGAAMMSLGDFAMYVAVLSAIGWVPLAVTTNLTINFLKKPAARDLLAQARLIKLGKRLAVGEIAIHSDGDDDLVAHVTSTYSIPSAR
jgi:uncharacterized protein (TIGR00369 family)